MVHGRNVRTTAGCSTIAILLPMLMAGCSSCARGDGCTLMAIEAATPILLPIALGAGAVRVAKYPFDSTHPAINGSAANVQPAGQIETTGSVALVSIENDGVVVAREADAEHRMVSCTAGHECSAASSPQPDSARAACGFNTISPTGAYCLSGRGKAARVVSLSRREPDTSVELADALRFGAYNTVSDAGEVFHPDAAEGFDRCIGAHSGHFAPTGGRVLLAARLGRRERLIQISVNGPPYDPGPPLLTLLDSEVGHVLTAISMPADTATIFGASSGPSGNWLTISYAPHGAPPRLALYRVLNDTVTLAGVISSGRSLEDAAFSPDEKLLAVLGTGAHDRVANRRISLFRLGTGAVGV